MSTITSADGTTIAYDRTGAGPPLILVVGAFNDRGAGVPLAQWLSGQFTVINYDRRGRGASTDTQPFAVNREIEDLAALIEVLGGSASVFGYSSGAVLALRAAAAGLPIDRLALYDPPFGIGGPDHWSDLAHRIDGLIAAGQRGDAVALYQTEGVGIPAEVVAQLRHAPFWPQLETIAPTLAYDAAALAWPMTELSTVPTPTLVVHGEAGPPPLGEAVRRVTDGLPDARLVGLPGQTHDLVPEVLGPVLTRFLSPE